VAGLDPGEHRGGDTERAGKIALLRGVRRPLTEAERDRYCAEAARVAPLLGLPADHAPTSAAELRRYLEGMLAGREIAVTETARGLARQVLAAPVPDGGPLAWPTRLATAGPLPPALRDAYGLPGGRRQGAALLLTAGLVRGLLPKLPTRLRHRPSAGPSLRPAAPPALPLVRGCD
jgi:uncharacterized protein (DUF2236 family)